MNEEIRRNSLEIARQLGYPTNTNLPLLDVPEGHRSLKEIADRLLCLHAAAACSFGLSKKKAQAWLLREALEPSLTQSERLYLKSSPDSDPRTAMQWQVESLWVLAWCVCRHEHVDFSETCSGNFVQMLPGLRNETPAESFLQSAKLRDQHEIIQKADLAYCLHWAVRDAQLRGQAIPGKVNEHVVVERRRALEWMISKDDWDAEHLDT